MHNAVGTLSPCFRKVERANKTQRTMGEGKAERIERRIPVLVSASRPCCYSQKWHSIYRNNRATATSQFRATFVWGTEAPWDSPAWGRGNLVFHALVAAAKGGMGRFVAPSQYLRPKDMKLIILQQNWNEQRKHFSMWHIIKLKHR